LHVARLSGSCFAHAVVVLREAVADLAPQILDLVLDGAEGIVERNGIDGVLRDELFAPTAGLLNEPLELGARLLEELVPLREDLLLSRVHRCPSKAVGLIDPAMGRRQYLHMKS
jgi:hypothetical protein